MGLALGHVAGGAESVAEIDDVMPPVSLFTRAGLDETVERITLFGVVIGDPRGDDPVAPELPAVLVGDAVVGIVAPSAPPGERPDGLALHVMAGQSPVVAVAVFGDAAEDLLQPFPVEGN